MRLCFTTGARLTIIPLSCGRGGRIPSSGSECAMRNLILIGMPGCGKSTLGVLLAKALGMDFVDTDLLLQKQSGRTLQRMVDELGTARFYQEEERCVLCLHAQNTVVATGGSVALQARAMNWLRKDGYVMFLKLSFPNVEKRLKNIQTRGIAMEKGGSLKTLYALRQPAYEHWADAVLEADGLETEQAVERLVALAKARGFGNVL